MSGMVAHLGLYKGVKVKLGCHVLRAIEITAYLEASGTLKKRASHGCG